MAPRLPARLPFNPLVSRAKRGAACRRAGSELATRTRPEGAWDGTATRDYGVADIRSSREPAAPPGGAARRHQGVTLAAASPRLGVAPHPPASEPRTRGRHSGQTPRAGLTRGAPGESRSGGRGAQPNGSARRFLQGCAARPDEGHRGLFWGHGGAAPRRGWWPHAHAHHRSP